MTEGLIGTVILYMILSVLGSGADIVTGNMTGMNGIFFPISRETGVFILMLLISNVMLSFMTVLLFLKRCDCHMTMTCFELRSRKRTALFLSQKRDLYRYWLAIVLGKSMVDLICFWFSGAFSLGDICYMILSFAVVSLLWMDMLYMLRAGGVDSRVALFLILFLVLLSLILLQKSGGISLFAYGRSANPILDITIKTILEILVFIRGICIVKKRDFI